MIRYPGSKDKISKAIMTRFPTEVMDALFQRSSMEYREPFFGGGAIGFALLDRLPASSTLWLNDKDFAMACLWRSVYEDPRGLIAKVVEFQPSVDAFYRMRDEDGRTDLDPVETGFRKFALHQISFSGFGAKAGGPIGGRKQSSAFNVGCRWNPARHAAHIAQNNQSLRRFSRVKITSGDFAPLIDKAPADAFIYADPPYYEKGAQLYKYSMTDADHDRLGASLKVCRSPWVLSYDDHPYIRRLYEPWANIESIDLTYTVATQVGGTRRKNSEIIITPRRASKDVAA